MEVHAQCPKKRSTAIRRRLERLVLVIGVLFA
jgi:hypothetical protein